MSLLSVAQNIKAEGLSLGFSLVGITSCQPPQSLDHYLEWLGSGCHAGMSYLASDRAKAHRANPHAILPGCRSIITVALPYDNPNSIPEPAPSQGRIAAYAWGLDYHPVIIGLLEHLASRIKQILGHPFEYRVYSDTGPILERDLSARAGLGWIGKNACLIHPFHGSYFLLGELFTTLDLEEDAQSIPDRCGSCRRCVDACPTACILPNRTIDSRHCISYLTIENKGTIPRDLREKLANRVFGCDVCQAVCPWNRFAPPTGSSLLQAGVPRAYVDLAQAYHQADTSFAVMYAGSPILRAKKQGFLRNLVVAMGNSGTDVYAPLLLDIMKSQPLPLVRAHAAWALGRLGTQEGRQAMEKLFTLEPDETVRQEILASLQEL